MIKRNLDMGLSKLQISKSYEIIVPDVPDSPIHIHPHEIHISMRKEKKIVESKELKKTESDMEYFKWCNCHIYLSRGGIFPDRCFKNCNLYPNNAHILETRAEFIYKLNRRRRNRKQND